MLNDYFSFMVKIITDHNGVVNKFMGDAVLALFNAPIDDPEHAKNAISCAIEIQSASQNRRFGKNLSIVTRIGINTGMVVVGNIGSSDRLEYTVIGDEVNIASRLEKLNKEYGTKILVGEKTYQLASTHFKFKMIGNIQLKGKHEPIAAYNVIQW